MKLKLTIHPPSPSGKIRISRMGGHHNPKKQYTINFCWLDPPGTWYDDEWNVHIDGCDYKFSNREKALAFISEMAAGFSKEYNEGAEFIETETPFPEK